ncbi:MAG: cell division protein FtsQ/DivIB [Xanthobacteraceae bacterium]
MAAAQLLERWSALLRRWLPARAGGIAMALFMLAVISYGVVKGDHLQPLVATASDVLDRIGNAAGFRIVSVALSGNQHVTREELLTTAGITGTTSLLFLDVGQTRDRLKKHAWIADATVLKLYPGELQIGVKERAPFALWQKDRHVSVIAEDGTVLQPYAPGHPDLPLVVGSAADQRAGELGALLERYPTIKEWVWASILVGERRWNLRLKNGLDVQLPETDPASALERLVQLQREKNLFTRDIRVVDLRLPDRVIVRLSETAGQARLDLLKEKAKKKGGSA